MKSASLTLLLVSSWLLSFHTAEKFLPESRPSLRERERERREREKGEVFLTSGLEESSSVPEDASEQGLGVVNESSAASTTMRQLEEDKKTFPNDSESSFVPEGSSRRESSERGLLQANESSAAASTARRPKGGRPRRELNIFFNTKKSRSKSKQLFDLKPIKLPKSIKLPWDKPKKNSKSRKHKPSKHHKNSDFGKARPSKYLMLVSYTAVFLSFIYVL